MTESVLNYILLINKKNNIHTKINQKVDFKVTSASGFDNIAYYLKEALKSDGVSTIYSVIETSCGNSSSFNIPSTLFAIE